MKMMCVFANGSEDCEYITVVDLLKRGSVDVDMVSIDEKIVTMARGTKIISDKLFDEIDNFDLYDGLFLPGGIPGTNAFKNNQKLLNLIKEFYIKGKLVSAICAAPSVFDKAGILEGNTYTMFSGMESDNKSGNYIDTGVVVSNNMITGKSLNYSVDLGLAIVEYLLGEEALNKVKKGIIRK